MTKRLIRLALLICDTPAPAVQEENGTYYDIFKAWLLASLKSYPDKDVANNTELVVTGYDVVTNQDYPTQDQLTGPEGYDVIMLTGSKHDSHNKESAWTQKLISYCRDVATSPATAHIKLVGICFGHQILSIALGGECIRNPAGWEIGVYGCDFEGEGKYWWNDSIGGEGDPQRVYVEQMHVDFVSKAPPGVDVLLKTPKCPVHSWVKIHPSSTPEDPVAQIFTIQGHPEFTPSIVEHIIDLRSGLKVFTPEMTSEARRRAGGISGQGGEGIGRLGYAIWRVMLKDLPRAPTNGYAASNGAAAPVAYLQDESRHASIDMLLDRAGPTTDESFQPGDVPKDSLRKTCKILVIGAGGLGCEILQNLALSGFSDIHLIDMDTIDISNLNRQFLFRESDVGKSKALVAADFVMRRVPGVTVTAHHSKIQDHPESFYMQFDIVIAGLDSISARRWINATLVGMVDSENPKSFKPLIDGGTEGFKGQARVILPTISSCYECTTSMLTPPTAFPICTIANTPRLPEHCIEWASVLEWPRVFKDKKLDTDDFEHIEWLYQVASSRAAQFKIEGVTWALTQGVVKNIIPAIASTNAIIAASCCNEALKIATSCAPYLNNYMMYAGNESVYTYTFESEQRPDCPVCGGETIVAEIGREWTLEKLVDWLEARQDLQIKRPSLSYASGKPLFFQAPPQLFEATKANLDKLVGDLVEDGGEIVVTDPGLPFPLNVAVKYE